MTSKTITIDGYEVTVEQIDGDFLVTDTTQPVEEEAAEIIRDEQIVDAPITAGTSSHTRDRYVTIEMVNSSSHSASKVSGRTMTALNDAGINVTAVMATTDLDDGTEDCGRPALRIWVEREA